MSRSSDDRSIKSLVLTKRERSSSHSSSWTAQNSAVHRLPSAADDISSCIWSHLNASSRTASLMRTRTTVPLRTRRGNDSNEGRWPQAHPLQRRNACHNPAPGSRKCPLKRRHTLHSFQVSYKVVSIQKKTEAQPTQPEERSRQPYKSRFIEHLAPEELGFVRGNDAAVTTAHAPQQYEPRNQIKDIIEEEEEHAKARPVSCALDFNVARARNGTHNGEGNGPMRQHSADDLRFSRVPEHNAGKRAPARPSSTDSNRPERKHGAKRLTRWMKKLKLPFSKNN